MRPPLAAVIFDLDDTLHDDTATYRRAAEAVAREVSTDDVAADALLRAYVAQAERFWSELQPSAFGTPLSGVRARMWAAALRAAGRPADDALAVRCATAYDGYRRSFLTLWPGALELLAGLRARGYKLAMITNGFAETHREKIAVLALENAFDEIVIADEVGLLKPDPRIFRLAAARLGVAPESCAMVGDRFERDVTGAHAVGMFSVWMNVRDEALPAGDVRPDAVVRDLAGVEAALGPARAASR